MNRLKYLSKNIALFSVSNFVTKILVFLLVPFYTNVLTTYEYGIADIIQVTLLLLVPMLTMNIGEAALRFGIEHSDKRGSILKIGIKYLLRSYVYVFVLCSVVFIFVKGSDIRWYVTLFFLLYLFNSLYEFLILYFQGAENVEIIVCGSITCTVLTIALNLLFLLVIRMGLNGYVFSQILAYAGASLLVLLLGYKKKVFENYVCDEELEKAMTAYSKPMIAYSTASWVNNAVDRYFVLYLCGAAVNGVYGVAYKIPAILMVFQRIFAQAWQMSATKAHKDEDSDEFYTNMYKTYNGMMMLMCSGIILFVKPLSAFLFRKDFYEAWRLVPSLLISVVFGALTGFLGSICLAHKDSKSMGISTGIGALVNVVLNAILIPRFSAMGASVATGISYFTMCMFAAYFVKKHVKLKINYVKNMVFYLLVVIEAIVMIKEIDYSYAVSAVIVALLIIANIKDIKEIISNVQARFQ